MRKKGWFMAVILVLIVGGCGRERDERQAAQAYLEGKYGEGFICTGQEKNLYDFDRSGQECWVRVDDETFQDNYQSLYYAAEVKRYFEEMAKENVGAESLIQTDTKGSYLGTQEILDCKHYLQECSEVSVVIYTDSAYKNKEADMKRLCQNLKTAGIGCLIRLYYVDSVYLYRLKQGEAFDESAQYVMAAGAAELTRDGGYVISWSK